MYFRHRPTLHEILILAARFDDEQSNDSEMKDDELTDVRAVLVERLVVRPIEPATPCCLPHMSVDGRRRQETKLRKKLIIKTCGHEISYVIV